MNIIEELERINLTSQTYENLMDDISKMKDGIERKDWQKLISKYDLPLNADSLRKMNDGIGGYFAYEYMKEKLAKQSSSLSENEFFKEMELKKREMFIETQKYRDIMNEYRQMQREQAREEATNKIIEDAFNKRCKYTRYEFKQKKDSLNDDVQIVASWADAHLGADFCIKGFDGEIINEYNPSIFKQRLNEFRNELIDFCHLNNTNRIHLIDLGDSIEGILHLSQLQAMKSYVVDDIIDYADIISDFVEDLTDNGLIIDMYTSEGNHGDCRLLTGKKGDFPHENFERIYFKWLAKATKNNENITLHTNLNGLNYFDVNGYKILSAHGQNEKNVKNSIKEYEDMFDIKINYFLVGHLHCKNEIEVSKDKEVIQVRSMMGINDYSQSIKKTSHAGATMFTIHKNYGKKYVNEVKFLY